MQDKHIRRLTFTFPSGHLKLPKPACESAASVVVPLKYVWLYTAPAISAPCTVDVCGSIYLSIYLFIYIHVSGVLTMLSCLVSLQLMSVGMRGGDATCASKCTHKKQFRHQCTAMPSLPSIIISLLHIIKLRQHCMAEATTEPVKCLIEDI